jgi:hypothetical protein
VEIFVRKSITSEDDTSAKFTSACVYITTPKTNGINSHSIVVIRRKLLNLECVTRDTRSATHMS